MTLTSIPGYTLLRPLGSGGMATVYLARQESLGREVALKVLASGGEPDAGVGAERFLREARIAASLHHPHIVPIHDFGVHEGSAYLAMEYEPGGTIAPIAGEKLAPRDALRLVRDIAGALDYAHGRGVVHRDIKPDNILRRGDGAAMLTDFGIARLIQGVSVLTTEGTSVGTPQYMSPEQLRGEKVDGRSDLYSLGVVLWQLLTGELPYTGNDGWAIGTQHITAPVPRLPEGLATLQPLVDALLVKQPDERLESGAELVRRIDALLAGSPTPPTSPATVAPRPASRRPSRVLALAGVACVALGLIGWFGWQRFGASGGAAVGASDRALAPAAAMPSSASGPAPASLPAEDKSIAVLPFENMSTDPEQIYFSDGLSEDLITALSQSGELRVIARDFSFRFRGHAADSRTIGAQLGVAHLLSGSVRRADDMVRISASLVNAADGSTLWSEHFDRPYRDLFKLQDEITAAVGSALKARLLGVARSPVQGDRPASGNLAAFTAFLQGRFHSATTTEDGLHAAIVDLDRAIALDPGYAQAYALRATFSTLLASLYGSEGGQPSELYARARADAKRALALSPGLARGHAALGRLAQASDLDLRTAESEFRQAVQVAPDDPSGWNLLSGALSGLGRLDEAAAASQQALRLDPLRPGTIKQIGAIDLARGRLDAAEQATRQALVLQPDDAFNYMRLCHIAIRRGDAAAARRAALQAPAGIWREHSIAMVAQISADRAAADAMLAQFVERHAVEAAFQVAELYAVRKDPGRAVAWLERARRQRDPGVMGLLNSPFLMDYRGDPRLVAFSESLGLPLPRSPEADAPKGIAR